MQPLRNIQATKRYSSYLSQETSNIVRKATLALAALIPCEAITSDALAGNILEKEKIVIKYADDSWKLLREEIKQSPTAKTNDTTPIWNNIISAFIVGDNTGIESLDNIRNEIIKLGKDNPEIPIDVLHTAIYSAGVNAETINKKEIREFVTSNEIEKAPERDNKTLKLVLEYLNQYPQNVLVEGKSGRKLTQITELPSETQATINNFRNTVNYSIAQLCQPEDIPSLVGTFSKTKDKSEDLNLLDIFIYLDTNKTIKIPPELINDLNKDIRNYFNNELKASESSPNIKTSIAKSILLLSQAEHKNTVDFCIQWFQLKSLNEPTSEADQIVLNALCKTTNFNENIPGPLGEVAATFPEMFFDAYFEACRTNLDSHKRQAGEEIRKFFNRNPSFANQLFASLLNKNAPMLSNNSNILEGDISEIREKAFTKGLITVSSLISKNSYVDTLRKLVTDEKEKEENKTIAMYGLVRARDKESIANLLDIAMNESCKERLRYDALKAALLIDSPDIFYGDFLKQLYANSPYSLDLHYSSGILDHEESSKYLFEIYPGSTEESALSYYVGAQDREYGGNRGYLKELSSNEIFKQKYLHPIINYLKECKSNKRIIDLKFAHLMFYALAKSGVSEASEVLSDIATYPELYIRKAPPNQITDSKYTTTNTAFIKLTALYCLGDVVDLQRQDDAGAKVLHTLSRFDSSDFFHTTTDYSLLALSKRYEQALKNEQVLKIAGKYNSTLLHEAVEYHKQESLKNLNSHIKNLSRERLYTDWYTDNSRTFVLSLTTAKLGGTKDLLQMILDNQNSRSNVTRAIVQSLLINEFQENDIEKQDFGTEDKNKLKNIYKEITEERFWLGDARDSGLTGKGVQIAVMDGGYIIPPKDFASLLDRAITVPTDFIGLHAPHNLLSRHAHSVGGGIRNIAPNVEILSLTWDDLSPLKPTYRPLFLTNDATSTTFEHLIEGIITGKYSPKLLNCSFGIKGWLINTKEDGVIGNLPNPDLRSSLLELLANTGTLPLVSIGNAYGMYPGDNRNGEVSEWNALGLRFLGDGKFSQPGNIIHVSTLDEYKGIVAPFNGIQDPLRANTKIESIGAHGALILPSFFQYRGTLANQPGSGSSFAVPRIVGALSLALEKANSLGISLTPQELRNIVFRTARDIPDSREFEVRKQLDTKNLIESIGR